MKVQKIREHYIQQLELKVMQQKAKLTEKMLKKMPENIDLKTSSTLSGFYVVRKSLLKAKQKHLEFIKNGEYSRITRGGNKMIDKFLAGKKLKTTLYDNSGDLLNVVEFKDGKVKRAISFVKGSDIVKSVKNYVGGKISTSVNLNNSVFPSSIIEYADGKVSKKVDIEKLTGNPHTITEYVGGKFKVNNEEKEQISKETKYFVDGNIKEVNLNTPDGSVGLAYYKKIGNALYQKKEPQNVVFVSKNSEGKLIKKTKRVPDEKSVGNVVKKMFGISENSVKEGKTVFNFLINKDLKNKYLGSDINLKSKGWCH